MTTNNDDVFSQTISVLIVDADTESPDNTQAAFAKMGIGTDCYGNEEQALEMVRLHHARRQEYDLILVDRSLPKKHGPEVVEDIRALLGENITTVIILTDDDEAGGAADADRVGADAFMKKPISVEEALKECRQIAARKKAGLVSDPALLALDGRRILIAWLYDWKKPLDEGADYAGALTLPRELRLDGARVLTRPVAEAAPLLTEADPLVRPEGESLVVDGRAIPIGERIERLEILRDSKTLEIFVNGGSRCVSYWFGR